MPHAGHRTREHGLTLTELLVSLGITSLLATTAVEHLPRFIQSARMAGDVNRFVTALHLARNEAVKRRRHLVLCPAAGGDVCAGQADWKNGWLLFPSDNNREREPEETLILRETPLTAGIAMRSGGRRKRIVYQPDGSSGGSNSSFTFCDRRGLASPRVICLSNTGRPRLSMTRCDGRPETCDRVE
jgi:type IV fimbrial biogenesis protein FimT